VLALSLGFFLRREGRQGCCATAASHNKE